MAGSHGRLYVPRSRGAASGFLLVLLGIWGGLMPYIGPYFDYTYTPDETWTWTAGRFWLQLLPGIATILGGLLLMASRSRIAASFGGWVAAAAGVWYVVGTLLSPLWDSNFIGQPVGDTTDRSVEQIGLFFGLGAAIILFAAFALGRLAVVGARDVEVSERYAEGRSTRRDVVPPDDHLEREHRSFLHGRHRHSDASAEKSVDVR